MRSRRLLAALWAAILALGAFAGPAAAADPQFSVTILGSKPVEVTGGQAVAYPVEIAGVNNTQTVNHVFAQVRLFVGEPVDGVELPSAAYLGSMTSTGSCDTPTPQQCDLGQFRPETPPAFVVFMFTAPTDTTISSVTAVVTVFAGEGATDADNAAHGDDFSDQAPTVIHHGDQGFFFSRYVLPRSFDAAETGVVETLQTISPTNRHATRVVVPDEATTAFGAAVTLREFVDVSPDPACLTPCFGETSSISVADGSVLEEGLVVTVTFGAPELPKGMTAKKLHVIHTFDEPGSEPVDAACGAVPVAPCRLSTVTLKDKSIVVELFLNRNGSIKGY